MNFRVIMVKRGIKIGATVPYGHKKEIIITHVSGKAEAKREARQRNPEWVPIEAVRTYNRGI